MEIYVVHDCTSIEDPIYGIYTTYESAVRVLDMELGDEGQIEKYVLPEGNDEFLWVMS